MKKTQLRKIIRESIKELMTEQGTPLNSNNQMAFRIQSTQLQTDGCQVLGGGSQDALCCNHPSNSGAFMSPGTNPSLYAGTPVSWMGDNYPYLFDYNNAGSFNIDYPCVDCSSNNGNINSILQHGFWAANAGWDCTTEYRDGMNCPVEFDANGVQQGLYIYPTMYDCEINDPMSSQYQGGIGVTPDPCVTSTNPNCGNICYACVNGVIYEEDPSFVTLPGGGWIQDYQNQDVCGYAQIAAFGSNPPSQPYDPNNSSLVANSSNSVIWWNSDTNQDFTYFGCSYSGGTTTTPVVLNFGCAIQSAGNYDSNADGCETPTGTTDPQDASCCIAPLGGGTNFGTIPTPFTMQQKVQGKQLTTPTPPNPNDPQMKRMKDLAFRGKRKR